MVAELLPQILPPQRSLTLTSIQTLTLKMADIKDIWYKFEHKLLGKTQGNETFIPSKEERMLHVTTCLENLAWNLPEWHKHGVQRKPTTRMVTGLFYHPQQPKQQPLLRHSTTTPLLWKLENSDTDFLEIWIPKTNLTGSKPNLGYSLISLTVRKEFLSGLVQSERWSADRRWRDDRRDAFL